MSHAVSPQGRSYPLSQTEGKRRFHHLDIRWNPLVSCFQAAGLGNLLHRKLLGHIDLHTGLAGILCLGDLMAYPNPDDIFLSEDLFLPTPLHFQGLYKCDLCHFLFLLS